MSSPPNSSSSSSNNLSSDSSARARKVSQSEKIKALAQKFEGTEPTQGQSSKNRRTSLPPQSHPSSRAPPRDQPSRRVTGPVPTSNTAQKVDSREERVRGGDGEGEQSKLIMSPLSQMDWTPRSNKAPEDPKSSRNGGSRSDTSKGTSKLEEGKGKSVEKASSSSTSSSSRPTSIPPPPPSSSSSNNISKPTSILSREERKNQTEMELKNSSSSAKDHQRPTLQLLTTTPIQPAVTAKPLLVQKHARGQNSPSSPNQDQDSASNEKVKVMEKSREKININEPTAANVVPPSVRIVNAKPSPALGNLPLEVPLPQTSSRNGIGKSEGEKEAGSIKLPPPTSSDSGNGKKKSDDADRNGKKGNQGSRPHEHRDAPKSESSKSIHHPHRPQLPSPSSPSMPIPIPDEPRSSIPSSRDSQRSSQPPSRSVPPSKSVEEDHHPLSPTSPSDSPQTNDPFSDGNQENGTRRSNQSGRKSTDPFRDPASGGTERRGRDSKDQDHESEDDDDDDEEKEKQPFFSNPVNGPASSLPSFNSGSPSEIPSNVGSSISTRLPLDSKPVAAASVFKSSAPPLHLPALERYLSDPFKFSEPYFSDPAILCTEEERALFGYDAQDGPRNLSPRKKKSSWFGNGSKVEIAGGQFEAPKLAMNFKPKSNGKNQSQVEDQDQDEEEDDEEEKGLMSQEKNQDGEKDQINSPVMDEKEHQSLNVLAKSDHSSSNSPNRPSAVTQESGLSVPTIGDVTVSAGIPSSLSTASNPLSRMECFPPLMLLKETSLVELKSNAVGPRAPPGGILGSIPPIGSILGTIIDTIIGAEGESIEAIRTRSSLMDRH